MNSILLNGLLYERQGTGISVYTGELSKHLIAKRSDQVDILLREEYSKLYHGQSNVHYAKKPINSSKDRILYEQVYGLKQYNEYPLVHFPDYAASLFYKGKKIITVHDMAMYTMKEAYTKKQVFVKKQLLKKSLKQADGIICDSHYAKKELLTYFPHIKEDHIRVIYLGMNEVEQPIEVGHQEIMNKFGITKPYLLYVGTIAPSKNVAMLMRAFQHIRDKGYDMQLVLVGKRGWMNDEVDQVYKQSSYNKDIYFTGFVTEEERDILYRQALIYVSPSLYEGFGLTPLEAMQREVPVAVSDIEIFREICGDAAAYFNPKDAEHMAHTFIQIAESQSMQQDLRVKGLRRSEQFSWDQTAELTYEFYQEVLKR